MILHNDIWGNTGVTKKIKKLYLCVDAACELHTIEPVIDNNRAFQSLTYHHSHLRPAQPTD